MSLDLRVFIYRKTTEIRSKESTFCCVGIIGLMLTINIGHLQLKSTYINNYYFIILNLWFFFFAGL